MKKTYPSLMLAVCLTLFALISLGCGALSKDTSGPAANTSAPANAASPAANTNKGAASSDVEIAGDYSITGTNEGGGGEYVGGLKITKRDKVYQFSWSSGQKTYDGVGVRTGNNVAVAFTEGSDGKGCGVVLYSIKGDGSLDGKVGYWGNNDSATENATRTTGTDLDGTYDVTGANPDGSSYKGRLAITKKGLGYSFAWDAGSTSTGFGIRSGDKVAVGIGGNQCGFVSYEVKPDGSLDGKWGGSGTTSVGTEVAKRK